ncbi:hypothetical protein BLA29_003563 [Euroglyphus maynei]|uniref:Uncharacterized protein n=1 Tax=Euroglyphus maynei TaxID=6958 RepID=A0A1Y3BD26_EURMA|nr:hypothetical protein BLA29_003563 [Euroglyphus maynei]
MSISTASSMTNLSTMSSSRNGKLKKRKFFENIVKRISSWITDDTRKLLGIDVNIAMQQNSIQLPEIVEYEDDEKKMERYRWEYIRLCARLNEEEIEDEKYDRMVCEERKRSKTNKKSVIKQNSSSTISPNNDSKETKMVRFTDDTKHDDGPIDSEKNNDDNDDGEMFFLPLNDNQHANVKRKQLFLQEIHTFLREILENQIENDEIFQQIHSLIRTFNLNSETTVLGRKENFLISIFLFRILILYRMLGDESNEFDVKYKSNIFIIKILDRFQLTYESIDENIDKIFNDDKK